MDETARLSFEEFELDRRRGELLRNGVPVPVEPQVLDLIAHLARHAGEVIDRDTLIETVWNGRIVSDSAIASRINAARAALGDDGTAQRIIKTVPRRGFRFEAQVSAASPGASGPRHEKPSVAVLPFENLSGDPEQRFFTDGITEDIITELSRYRELFVAARHSSFAYRDLSDAPARMAEDLGVQYIAEGSVRRAGNRIRVTARLSDPAAGELLWSERYDREATDLFEVQDEITSMIVNTLAGQIDHRHRLRAMSKSPDTLTAYEHVLKGLQLVWQFDPEIHERARAEADKALALDPTAARAHAIKSWSYLHLANNAFSDDIDGDFEAARREALQAVAADDADPWAHATLGWVHQWADRAFDRANRELDRAIALNPGNVQYRSLKAFSMTYSGASEAALEILTDAMRRNPHVPVAHHIFIGRALFNLERFAEAIPHLERVRTAQPTHPNALAIVAACYAANGQSEEARDTAAEVTAANPRFTLSHARRTLPYERDIERDRFLEMLAKAGLPE